MADTLTFGQDEQPVPLPDLPAIPMASAGGTLHVRIVQHLAGQILSGALPEGWLFPKEADIAAQFGISRPVVREAMKILAAKGLVEARRKRGTIVLPSRDWNLFDAELLSWWPGHALNPEMSESLLETRRAFEPVAAELAAQRRDQTDLVELMDALDRMGSAGTPEDFSLADLDFHRVLFRATRSPMIVQLGRLLDPLLQIFLDTDRTLWNGPDRASVQMHRIVAEAIAQSDGAAARRGMEGLIEWTCYLARSRRKDGA